MAVNKTLWLSEFKVSDLPHWPCPTCHEGWLTLEPRTYHTSESESSKKENSKYVAANVPWAKGVFSCILICNNRRCRESIALSGCYDVQEEWLDDELSGQPYQTYSDFCIPITFVPTVHLFAVPKFVPQIIAEAVIDSFKTFWLDPSSCANKIRTAVEVVLTHKKVRKIEIKNNKKKHLTLHKRIQLFKISHPSAAEKLEAIKWIGNEGSHSNKTSKEDLIDAYDILSSLLHQLYETETERIVKLSKKIVSKQNPLRSRGIK